MKAIAVAMTPIPVPRRAGRQCGRRDDGRHAGARLWHAAHLGQRPEADRVDPQGGRLGHAGEAATHLASDIFVSLTLGTGKFSDGLAARSRRGLRLVYRRAGGQILFRAWRLVGRRSTQDHRHPHLAATDKQSVLERLQAEIRRKLTSNRHSGQKA